MPLGGCSGRGYAGSGFLPPARIMVVISSGPISVFASSASSEAGFGAAVYSFVTNVRVLWNSTRNTDETPSRSGQTVAAQPEDRALADAGELPHAKERQKFSNGP